MAEAKSSVDWSLVVIVLLVGLFAGALFFPRDNPVYVPNVTCPSCENLISGDSELSVIYLYPMDCTECNVSRVNAIVSSTGVPFMAFMNDAVSYPNIILTYQNISTIARASNDFNVISTLCTGRNQMACSMKESMSLVMHSCLQKNNVPLDSVVYLYSDWCGTLCNNMNSSLKKIEDAGYTVVWINEKDSSVERDCLKEFLNYAGGFPQFICPRRVISYTGALTYDSLESFAEECGK